jgi:hypothetical protein
MARKFHAVLSVGGAGPDSARRRIDRLDFDFLKNETAVSADDELAKRLQEGLSLTPEILRDKESMSIYQEVSLRMFQQPLNQLAIDKLREIDGEEGLRLYMEIYNSRKK